MTDTQQEPVSVAIIGSGPAGYTAAIYAARAGLPVVLYQGTQPGGQLTTTTEVENYPGYAEGVLGTQMMLDFQRQAQRFGTDVQTATITAVDFSVYPFQLTADDQHSILAKSVIVATGAAARWLGLPAEQRLNGRGVSACATCDGFFFKGQAVAVVGGGDSAAEEATYLANICKPVHLLVRRGQMRASAIMQQRVMRNPNIKIHWHTEVEDILGEQEVTGVLVVNNRTQAKTEIPVKGFFVAIGHHPNTAMFAPYLQQDAQGYIQTIPGTTQTNVPGIFAAGDVQDAIYRQAVTAAGTGCMAALEAERFLASQADKA
ncbi:MAG: thioredoxin-disulfide reductase [Bacteroidota bacterium]